MTGAVPIGVTMYYLVWVRSTSRLRGTEKISSDPPGLVFTFSLEESLLEQVELMGR